MSTASPTTSPLPLPLEVDDLTLELDGGAQVHRTVLPNGVRVISEHIPGAHSASIGFWVPVGSRDEHEGQFGSTHFLEHLLFKGTAARTALDIAIAFDEVGGESNALTGKEYTCYYAKVRDADLPMATEVLTDMVVGSLLDTEEFDRERQVILEELAMSEDDPTDVVHELFGSLAYAGQALGRPIGGTRESIGAVQRDAVWEHYRANYRPEDIVVAVAGAVDHSRLLEQLHHAFAQQGWDAASHGPLHARRSHELLPTPAQQSAQVVSRDAEQVNLIIGTRGIPASDDRRFSLSVLNAILGGGMSSRLFQEVREKRGLAYSVYSFGGTYADAGTFGMYAGTRPETAGQVAGLLRDVLARFADEGPTDAELARAHGQLSGAITLGFEDSSQHMTRLGKSEIGLGELWDLPASIARLRQVSASDVQQLAQLFATSPQHVAAVGPVDEEALHG
ncbi:M16 family metallopeptidase [Pseudoclavibacter soli]|uniref:M16 family metallopeptidase n=1 Tax=Pseudoclavibacter soli TaxID=452623 RepID=UPI00041BC048|nr:pitrilysin family protein [Pseudoclavibacter soli]